MNRTSRVVCIALLNYCFISIWIYSVKFLFLCFPVKIVLKFVYQMIHLALGKM